MLNMIFFTIITTLFINFSFGAISFSGINRTFELLYKGVVESSVLRVDNDGLPCKPYISKSLLIDNAESYFASNIKRYVSNYVTSYYFYNYNDGSYCTSSYCDGVKISLKATINQLFNYDKAKAYYIYGK